MTRLLTTAFAVALAAIATPALADDDRLCANGNTGWMSVGDATARAEAAGYTVREIERDDGCYEIEAVRGDGQRVEIKMHPTTGEVMREKMDD